MHNGLMSANLSDWISRLCCCRFLCHSERLSKSRVQPQSCQDVPERFWHTQSVSTILQLVPLEQRHDCSNALQTERQLRLLKAPSLLLEIAIAGWIGCHRFHKLVRPSGLAKTRVTKSLRLTFFAGIFRRSQESTLTLLTLRRTPNPSSCSSLCRTSAASAGSKHSRRRSTHLSVP